MNDKLKNVITWFLIIGLSIALIISLISNIKNNSFTELSDYKEQIASYEEDLKSYETKIEELTEELENSKLVKEDKQKELESENSVIAEAIKLELERLNIT